MLAAEVVYTTEIDESLARAEAPPRATGRRARAPSGYGLRGWPEAASFDILVVTGTPREVLAAPVERLVPGGRLVGP